GTGQRGSADPQPIGVFAQPGAEQENRRIPRPGHEMVPGEGIRVGDSGEDDVSSSQQRQGHPELAPRAASAKVEQRRRYRSKGQGMGHKANRDRKKNKNISQ